jgi:hypothetical protein
MASGSTAPFSGDHADLENVNSGQHHNAATPDGLTIITNSNGDLKAKIPSTTIIGDFQSNIGDWKQSTTSGNVFFDTSNGGAESTSRYIILQGFEPSSQERIFRDKDLTNITSLVFHYKGDPREIGNDSVDVRLNLDGSQQFSTSNLDNTVWKKVKIDVSSFSGNTTIELIQKNNDDTFSEIGFDRIKLVKEELKLFDGAGN